jgi:hypothetical protein
MAWGFHEESAAIESSRDKRFYHQNYLPNPKRQLDKSWAQRYSVSGRAPLTSFEAVKRWSKLNEWLCIKNDIVDADKMGAECTQSAFINHRGRPTVCIFGNGTECRAGPGNPNKKISGISA